jgi:uncharacterized membrane protein YraQ (UPF0718 family)
MDYFLIKKSFTKTFNGFKKFLPVIFGVILLTSLLLTIIPKELYSKLFTGNVVLDSFFGATVGSVSAGNPLVSYIIGGELLTKEVSLIAITAFILTWVGVGVVQLPAEITALGRRFAITRNILSFVTALIIAVLTVFTISLL